MEQVTVLSRSLEFLQGSNKMSPGPATTHRLTQYANLLAAQGSLATAMSFLPSDCIQVRVAMIKSKSSSSFIQQHAHPCFTSCTNAVAPRTDKIFLL